MCEVTKRWIFRLIISTRKTSYVCVCDLKSGMGSSVANHTFKIFSLWLHSN